MAMERVNYLDNNFSLFFLYTINIIDSLCDVMKNKTTIYEFVIMNIRIRKIKYFLNKE